MPTRCATSTSPSASPRSSIDTRTRCARAPKGGLTRTEIARAVGVPREIVRRVWRELGLPERAPDIPRLQRVLRIETCVECGREFEWTIGMETNYRQGMKKYVVCSVRCGAIGRSRRQREGS